MGRSAPTTSSPIVARADAGGHEPHHHGQDHLRPGLLQGGPLAGLRAACYAGAAARTSSSSASTSNRIQDDAGWNLLLPRPHHLPQPERVPDLDSGRSFWWPVLAEAPHARASTCPSTARCPTRPADATPRSTSTSPRSASFAQDQWNAASKLTLTYGVRYDLESYPAGSSSKKDTEQHPAPPRPRLRLQPRGVVRGGLRPLHGPAGEQRGPGVHGGRLVEPRRRSRTRVRAVPHGRARSRALPPDDGRRARARRRPRSPSSPPGSAPRRGATSLTDNMSAELVRTPTACQASAAVSPQELGDGFALSGQLPVRAGPGPARPHRQPERGPDGRRCHRQAHHRTGASSPSSGTSTSPTTSATRTTTAGRSSCGSPVPRRHRVHGVSLHALARTRWPTWSPITNLGDFPECPDLSHEEWSLRASTCAPRARSSFMSQVPKERVRAGRASGSRPWSPRAAGASSPSSWARTPTATATRNADRVGMLGTQHAGRAGLLQRRRAAGARVPARAGACGARLSVDVFNRLQPRRTSAT